MKINVIRAVVQLCGFWIYCCEAALNPLFDPILFEGDILLTENGAGRNAIADPKKLWPNAGIIYKVDESVGCPNSRQCSLLMEVLDEFQERTCVRFQEWFGQPNYALIFFSEVNSDSCWSQVGMDGGEQMVSLSLKCWYKGIVLHELCHTIGLYHEMNRPDRDQYITIHWDNIIPLYKDSFTKYPEELINTLGESFDYTSVMLYDEYAFSKDEFSPTVTANDGRTIGPIWMKHNLSRTDVRRITKLYSCNGNEVRPGFPPDQSCDFSKNNCGFQSIPRNSWRNITGEYISTTLNTTGNRAGLLVSPNFHPKKASDPRGSLGCIKFKHFIQTNGQTSLKVSIAYLKKTTSQTYDTKNIHHLWQSNQETHNSWTSTQLSFYTTKPFKVIFESQFKGNASYGLTALDDIQILYSDCRTLCHEDP